MAPTPDRDRDHSPLVAILGPAPIPVAEPVAGFLQRFRKTLSRVKKKKKELIHCG
jgi:hypothetical protein